MKFFNGSLTYKDYENLYKERKIINNNFKKSQIQPSSVDLTLSEECYEINASFLSSSKKVRDNLKKIIKKINLKNKYIFKKNKTYLVRLNESLNLPNNVFGICNPKVALEDLIFFVEQF